MKKTLLITLLSASGFSIASDNTTIEQQVKICSVINDNTNRLVCYDKITLQQSTVVTPKKTAFVATIQPQIAASSEKPSKFPTPESPAQTVESQEQQIAKFGAQRIESKKEKLEEVYLTVSKIKTSLRGLKTFYFNNGQIWKELSKSRFKAREGEQVVIKKAALGSFLLGSSKNNRTTRVKRIK